jgi:RNA-directed DNA polymerase
VGGGSAGVLEGQDFTSTEEGTPQGGVISPLLANVALHGMEEVAKEGFATYGSVENPILVRYADDFVILYSDKVELQRVAERVTAWLADMGLQLSPKKTRTTHTLETWGLTSWGTRYVNFAWEKLTRERIRTERH